MMSYRVETNFGEPFDSRLEDRAFRRITDSDRSFPACAKRHARGQSHPTGQEQLLAKREAIHKTIHFRKQVECALG